MAIIDDLQVLIGADTGEAEKEVKGFGGFVRDNFGKIMAGAGAAAGALFVKKLGDALNIDAASDKLAAQLDLTAEESERIGGVAGDLYADAYGDSIEQVNQATGAVVSSIEGMRSASDEALSGMTAHALDFAATFDIDVQRAVGSAGVLIKSGLAEDGIEAFDLLTAASQRVPAQFREDVLDASDEYAQFFDSLGFDAQHAFGVLVAGAQEGMYGVDKAGDAIKEFTIRSTDMSTASQEAYEAIGLDAQLMAENLLKGGDYASEAFSQIVDGLLSIESPADQANASIALFGTPLEDLNVNEIPKFLESLRSGGEEMEGFAGSAERMGETLNDNAKTDLEAFKRGMDQNVIGALGPVVGILNDLPGPANTAISTLLGFGALAAPLGPFLMAISMMPGKINLVTTATKIWEGAQKALNFVLRANPIGIVITLIAGLVAGIIWAYHNFEGFRNVVDGVFRFLGGVVGWFVDFFKGIFVGGVSWAIDAVVGYFSWWGGMIQGTFSFVGDVVGWLIDLFRHVPGWISSAFGGLVDIITWPFRTAFNWVRSAWNNTVGGFGFTVPDWVPMVGGRSFRIPYMAEGGTVLAPGLAMVGERGPELLHLPQGASVQPLNGGGIAGAGGKLTVELVGGDEEMLNLFRKMIRVRGGDVQVVLGT